MTNIVGQECRYATYQVSSRSSRKDQFSKNELEMRDSEESVPVVDGTIWPGDSIDKFIPASFHKRQMALPYLSMSEIAGDLPFDCGKGICKFFFSYLQ